MDKTTLKKILATFAIIAVVFCSAATSAFVINFAVDTFDKVLAVLTIIGIVGLSAALFKKF